MFLAISLVPATFNYIMESVLYAKENMKAPAIISVVEVAIKVVVGVTVLVLFKSLVLVFLTILISRGFSTLFLSFVLKKEMGSIKFLWDKRFTWSLFKSTLTFTAITVVAATYWRLDILMLSSMMNETAVGFYSAAYRFFAIALLISESYVIAFFPVISKLHLESAQKFRYVCGKSIKWLFIALVPVTLGLWLLGQNLITLIYGEEFTASFSVFRILILALVPMAVAQVFARTLLASGNQRVDLLINIVGLGLNFALNLFFIPKYGIVGAALATFIVTCANLAILSGILWHKLFDAQNILTGVKLLLAGMLLIGTAYWLQDTSLIFKLIIPLLVYGVFLLITGSIDKAEKNMVSAGFRSRAY
jgi:O-antigen/teichoic acid export membrane protein